MKTQKTLVRRGNTPRGITIWEDCRRRRKRGVKRKRGRHGCEDHGSKWTETSFLRIRHWFNFNQSSNCLPTFEKDSDNRTIFYLLDLYRRYSLDHRKILTSHFLKNFWKLSASVARTNLINYMLINYTVKFIMSNYTQFKSFFIIPIDRHCSYSKSHYFN